MIWALSEKEEFVQSTNGDSTTKDKHICNVVEPRATLPDRRAPVIRTDLLPISSALCTEMAKRSKGCRLARSLYSVLKFKKYDFFFKECIYVFRIILRQNGAYLLS